MITGYKIKQINNEEVLYIYLDFNYEFGNFKETTDNLKKTIKEFIKKNKIVFKGTMVALVVSGMVTGSMNIKESSKPISNINNELIISEKVLDDLNIPENIIVNEQKEETIDNYVEEKDGVQEEKIEDKNIKENNTQKEEYGSSKENKIVDQDNILVETHELQNTLEKEEVNEQTIEEVIDNKTYVTVRRSSGEIQNIELEEYIIGVVGAEMPASFHIEALKSQAVIARTYALKAISRGQTLTDNESTQSYKDNSQLQNLWGSSYNTYYNKIKDAVLSTEGMYLTYNGSFIEAVYHSTSNGTTENASYVWGNSFPYLISVDSPFDNTNPSFIQEKNISYEELSSKLGSDINIDTEFNILGFTTGNRVENIEINGIIYKGPQLRQILGLRSTDFDITKTESGIIFTTKGYGHGVGLSQYGANGMAKNGYSYIDILLHYYPGITINY